MLPLLGVLTDPGNSPTQGSGLQMVAARSDGSLVVRVTSTSGPDVAFKQLANDINSAPDDQQNNLAVVSFPFMLRAVGPGVFDRTFTQFKACALGAEGGLTDSLQVAEPPNEMLTNSPAADTQAEINFAPAADQGVIVTRLGYSVAAVNAIAVPILVELVQNSFTIWSEYVLAPAGTVVSVMRDVRIAFSGSTDPITLRCAAPGAGNFATVNMELNSSWGVV